MEERDEKAPIDTVNEPKNLFFEIMLLAVICGLASGSIYYSRFNYIDLTPLGHNIFRTVRMMVFYFLIPLFWLVKIRKLKFTDLGITRNNLWKSIILGIGVYGIALVIFLLSLGDPEFDKVFLWGNNIPLSEFIITMVLIACMSALTDIWTRGTIMIPILKSRGILTALIVQNIFWFASHIYEINLMVDALTLAGAVALTLTLGILGDLVAIKTKNIIGLSVGHIALNMIFFGYIRIAF